MNHSSINWGSAAGLILVLLLAAIAVEAVLSSRTNNYFSVGVFSTEPLPSLGSEISYLEYELPPNVQRVQTLLLFADSESAEKNQGNSFTLDVIGSEKRSRTVTLGTPSPGYHERVGPSKIRTTLVFDYDLVTANVGQPLRLVIKSNNERSDLELLSTPHFDMRLKSRLIIDGERIAGRDLAVQTRYINSARLWRIVLVLGVVTLVILSAVEDYRTHRRLSVLAFAGTAFALQIILGEFSWQARLETFWGNFWPDGYVAYADQIRQWLIGGQSWEELSQYIHTVRNAQAWVVPALLVPLYQAGLTWLTAYTVLNLLFCAGTIYCWLAVMRDRWQLPTRLILVSILPIALHYAHTFIATTPMTDAAAMFFVSAFFLVLNRAIYAQPHAARLWSLLLSVVLVFGVQARVALMPLLMTVPVVAGWFAVWHRFEKGNDGLRTVAVRLFLSSLLAGGLLAASYAILGLIDSLLMTYDTATGSLFTPLFDAGEYWTYTAQICLLPLIAALVGGRETLADPWRMSIVVFAGGYLTMLYLGQIATWLRYWAPLVGPTTFILLEVAQQKLPQRYYLAAVILFLGLHAYWVFTDTLDIM